MLPQNAATPQNIQISNVERLCCSARRRRQLERHFNLFRFQKETSSGRALLTLPPTEARQFQVSAFTSSCTSKNPKKIVLPQADLNFEFQSQPWWTKCEWRLPPLDIKSKFSKLNISTTKKPSQMKVAPRPMLLTWFTLLLTLS